MGWAAAADVRLSAPTVLQLALALHRPGLERAAASAAPLSIDHTSAIAQWGREQINHVRCATKRTTSAGRSSQVDAEGTFAEGRERKTKRSIRLEPGVALTVPPLHAQMVELRELHQPLSPLGLATVRPVGSKSVNLTPGMVLFGFGLIIP